MIVDLSQVSAEFATAVQFLLAAAVVTAALSAYRLWRIAQREESQRVRLDAFRGGGTATSAPIGGRQPWYHRLGLAIAGSAIVGTVERQQLLKRLAQAGLKGRGSFINFIAAKACSAAVVLVLGWFFLEWRGLFAHSMVLRLAPLAVALIVGWRLPEYVLDNLIKRRRFRLEKGMPDALDLLVICTEAGLSLNQAIDEVSRQLRLSNEDVADEFAATSAEMQITSDFGRALDNMVERTGLEELRSLVATLKQSLKFGTPLAESLRMIASEMRQTRHARIEERAARLPVLLAIPMMMFILPCLLMIVGTPAVLRIIDMFKNITFTIGTP
jgi:tight adherence protein C